MSDMSSGAAGQGTGASPVVLEMRGPNILIRSTASIDETYTISLVEAVNAATATNTVVIIDPEPIRCDEAFAAASGPTTTPTCVHHVSCEPVEVAVASSTMIRIAAERDTWIIDLKNGRLCQAAPRAHLRHLGPEAWIPVIAVAVTPKQLTALTKTGTMITSTRAHRPTATPSPIQ